MPTTVQVTPDRIMQMAHGFWPAAILSSAAAWDFFTHIAHGHTTADAVAAAAGTDPRGTRMVLDSLVALEFLTKQGGRYALTPDSDAFLVRDRRTSIVEMIAGQPPLMWEDCGRLREGRKTDKLTLAYFFATKNRDLDEALKAIEAERAHRGGVYVDDVYGWVLFRLGRLEDECDVWHHRSDKNAHHRHDGDELQTNGQ